jgi:membrane associated rhomboid family serine protease
MKFTWSVSNTLILISAVFTLLAFLFPQFYVFWVNTYFLEQGQYHIFIAQFFSGTFLHGWVFHLFANSIFLYLFGNILEMLIWKNKFIVFFFFVVIFNGVLLSVFSDGNTIGISGFCMALLSYYTLELKWRNNPEYKWGITALLLNIWIWFMPWMSLLGHLFWAIWWVIFYYLTKEYLRRKMVWASLPL